MKSRQNSFFRDASVTLIVSLILLETLPYLGVFPKPPSSFTYPLDIIISSLIILFATFGIYGIMTENRFGGHLALLASVWKAILGVLLLTMLYRSTFQTSLLISGLTQITLGLSSALCISRLIFSPNGTDVSTSGRIPNSGYLGSEFCVEITDLEKMYVADPVVVPAVNGINLKVKRGEFISIMGPSGCGKSTLLNLIGALDRPTAGKVLIDGVDISLLDPKSLAKLRNEKIGFIFQAYNLINRSTVFRNIELPVIVKGLPKDERAKRVLEILDVVGMSDKAYRKPRMLSGGEQQRAAIARALINEPSIILADEPTGNLDSKSGNNIISFMRKLNREIGTTIIVVTHSREVAEMTDRIINLRDGRIIGEEVKAG